jgi:NO-binding membrane sensor protein with MHYT domain
MKAYVVTTGMIFGLLVAVHLWRMLAENPQLATDPIYLAITVVAGGLAIWSWRVVRLFPPR